MDSEKATTQTSASDDLKQAKAVDFIVQYIVLRKDLNWPLGALIAQSCHAATSAMHLFSSDDVTQAYLSDLNNMHKVVLGVDNLADLESLNKKLIENNVKFKLWTEQPENIATAIATKPYMKKEIERFFKKFKLLK